MYFELEGPLVYKQITDEQKAIFTIADLVEPEVDPTFQAASEMYPGLGLRLLDINSTVVATLEYKLYHEPDSYVRRAIIYTDKGLYTFSVTMHQSQPDSDAESLLELILRVAVDSGEL